MNTRRPFPEIALGIGSYIEALQVLTHLSVLINCSIYYFSSAASHKFFVNDTDENSSGLFTSV